MSYSDRFNQGVKTLSPGYFALVMATGIVSMACLQLDFVSLGKSFFVLNNGLYLILLILFIARIVFFFQDFKKDLGDHAKGAAFLSLVAASCILGTGYVQGKQMFLPGLILLVFSFIAWQILLYSFLAQSILINGKPSLEKGMNGSWLLLVVSTQALVILAVSLVPYLQLPVNRLLFVTIAAWLLGLLLYFILAAIIIYRLTFYPVTAAEVTPDYWIDTGAAAITALAGASLSSSLSPVMQYQQFIPAVNLLSILAWAAASFWLPLLFILETWRHYKAGVKYSAGYWSMVFPLGMYTVATLKLATVLKTPFLKPIAGGFIYIALITWAIVFVGMILKLGKTLLATSEDYSK